MVTTYQFNIKRTRDGTVLEGRSDTRNFTFVDLAEYEEYCVVVSGGTYMGMGPYSKQHCAFTEEDSKKFLSCYRILFS